MISISKIAVGGRHLQNVGAGNRVLVMRLVFIFKLASLAVSDPSFLGTRRLVFGIDWFIYLWLRRTPETCVLIPKS